MRAGAAPDRHRLAGMLSLRWPRGVQREQAFGQARQVLRDNRLTCTIYTLGSPHRDPEHGQQRSALIGDRATAPSTFLLIPQGHPTIGAFSMNVSTSASGLKGLLRRASAAKVDR
jgi:hypothetical protein